MSDAISSQSDTPQKKKSSRNTSQMKRVSLYMQDELISALNAQVKTDRTNKNTFIVQLLQLLLLSEAGQKLRSNTKESGHHLVEELRDYLILFTDQMPLEEISQLGRECQRNTPQMLLHLAILGLNAYKQQLKRKKPNQSWVNALIYFNYY